MIQDSFRKSADRPRFPFSQVDDRTESRQDSISIFLCLLWLFLLVLHASFYTLVLSLLLVLLLVLLLEWRLSQFVVSLISFLFVCLFSVSLSLSLIRYFCLGVSVCLSLSFFPTFSLSVSHSDLILTFSEPATPHQMLYGLGFLPITADTWWSCPIVPDYRSSWTPFSPGSRRPSPFCACRPPGAEPCWGLEVPCCLSHTHSIVRSWGSLMSSPQGLGPSWSCCEILVVGVPPSANIVNVWGRLAVCFDVSPEAKQTDSCQYVQGWQGGGL